MKKKHSRKISIDEYVEIKLNQNEGALLQKIRKNNPDRFADAPKSYIIKTVSNEVKLNMSEYDESLSKAFQRYTRSRAVKTQSEFYIEGLKAEIKGSELQIKGVETKWKRLQNFYRDKKGRFLKITNVTYMGNVEINKTMWKQYRFINPMGMVMYFYSTQSPKTESYESMLTEKNYAEKNN